MHSLLKHQPATCAEPFIKTNLYTVLIMTTSNQTTSILAPVFYINRVEMLHVFLTSIDAK